VDVEAWTKTEETDEKNRCRELNPLILWNGDFPPIYFNHSWGFYYVSNEENNDKKITE
jgi:hypothetical protein